MESSLLHLVRIACYVLLLAPIALIRLVRIELFVLTSSGELSGRFLSLAVIILALVVMAGSARIVLMILLRVLVPLLAARGTLLVHVALLGHPTNSLSGRAANRALRQ
jgi:hypothetical protein